MLPPILSAATVLNARVCTAEGLQLAVVDDLVWNKANGRITYLILSTSSIPASGGGATEPRQFAIHPSYFYLPEVGSHLVFNGKIGKDPYGFLLDLPPAYATVTIQDLTSFQRFVDCCVVSAGHRSDYE